MRRCARRRVGGRGQYAHEAVSHPNAGFLLADVPILLVVYYSTETSFGLFRGSRIYEKQFDG